MGESKNAHERVYGGGDGYVGNYDGYRGDQQEQRHHSSWTHEIVAGAAGFAAMKAYEDHVRRTGEQVSHPLMKEMLAGFAAAEVDKLFETKGLDFLDREKAKRHAIQQAHSLAEEQYGSGGTFNGQYNQYGNEPGNYQQQQGGYRNDQFGGQNYPQQGGYGGGQFGGQNYPQQGGYGGGQFGGQNYPPPGGYGGGQFGGQNYPQQGGYGGGQFGGQNYQQQGGKRHHHHQNY